MGDVKTFVEGLVGQIKASAPAASRRVFGPVIGPCPGCGGELHLRDWEGKHYAKCAGAECRVAFDCDEKGQPLVSCRFCQGPVRTTKSGSQVCVACRRWQEEGPAGEMPDAPLCAQCGQPMRVIPSTRKGQFFLRCSPCGITREAGGAKPAATEFPS